MHEERDGKFNFYRNLLGRLTNPVELSYEQVLINSKYQGPELYDILLYDYEEVSFEVPTGYKKVGVTIKPLLVPNKLHVLQDSNSVWVFCSLSSASSCFLQSCSRFFKDGILTSPKENYRLQISLDVLLDNVKQKGNPRCKLLYKLFEEQYGYDPLLDTSLLPTLIQFTYFIGGIQYCVIVLGVNIFYHSIPFALTLICDKLDRLLLH